MFEMNISGSIIDGLLQNLVDQFNYGSIVGAGFQIFDFFLSGGSFFRVFLWRIRQYALNGIGPNAIIFLDGFRNIGTFR